MLTIPRHWQVHTCTLGMPVTSTAHVVQTSTALKTKESFMLLEKITLKGKNTKFAVHGSHPLSIASFLPLPTSPYLPPAIPLIIYFEKEKEPLDICKYWKHLSNWTLHTVYSDVMQQWKRSQSDGKSNQKSTRWQFRIKITTATKENSTTITSDMPVQDNLSLHKQ